MVGRGLILFLTLGLLAGCGPSSTEKEAERLRGAIAAETGQTNTLLQIVDGEIRIRSGGQQLTVNQTAYQSRPEHLPSDIILPPDARIDLWTEGLHGCTLSCLTDASPDQSAPFFLAQWVTQGWEKVSDVQTDRMRRLTFRKPGRLVSITLEPDFQQLSTTRALFFIETHEEER